MPATALDPRLLNPELLAMAAVRLKHRQASPPSSIAVPETTLYEFATQRPWLIDRHAFDWDQHRYQIPLYEAFRLTPGENDGLSMVVLKGAQTGASTFGMLGLIFIALKFPGSWTSYFLPDQTLTHIFSDNRFRPMVQSNAPIAKLLGGDDGTETNSNRLRRLGSSSISFGYMGGKTSTESLPLLGVLFDEVRRMSGLEINLAQERYSHSAYPIDIKMSTAGYPEQDIHAYFLRSTQQYFQSTCRCPDGISLAEAWPECLGFQGGAIFYRCPRCDTRIVNPQDGRYVARAPENRIPGFHLPQTLSLAPLHQPAQLWAKYTDPQQDRGEFHRSTLGLPYIDAEAQLVTLADLAACEDPELPWATEGTNSFVGIDQMGGWNDVVILGRTARGEKLRLLHVERLAGEDPWDDGRLDSLMRRYDVACACVDLNPGYNEAMRFARRWLGRVWLVTYSSQERADMIAWRDRRKPKDQTPNEPEARFRFVVTIQRYKALDYALGLYRERLITLPHPRGLTQTMPDDHGVTRPVFVGEELFWPHMTRIVRQKRILDEEQGTSRMVMEKVGADPHFAFAYTYSVVAASRLAGGRVSIL